MMLKHVSILFSSAEHKKTVEETANLFQVLKSNNETTGNIASLLKVFLARATELKASAQCDK